LADFFVQSGAFWRLLVTIVHFNRLKTGALATLGLFTFAGVGCNVGIDYKTPPTTAPANFGEIYSSTQPSTQPSTLPTTKPIADLGHYWKSFNDPELDKLIDRAVKNNNTFLQAQASVRQARAQLGVDIGTVLPSLTANAGITREQVSRNLSTANGGSSTGAGASSGALTSLSNSIPRRSNIFRGTLDSSWEIDVFGGGRRLIESGADSLEASIDARRYALVTLTAEVAGDYVALRGYQLQLKLTKDNAKSEQDTLELTKSRFNAGLVSDLDVAQAEASVAQTVAQEPALEIQIRQTIHAISILLGEEPTALTKELEQMKPIPPTPSEIPVGIPSDLLRNRPDVMQAERQLAAATANIGVSVSNLFPKFSLTGEVGQESGRLGLIARQGSSIWSIGPTMSWQILDYYQLQSEVRVSNAEQAQALYAYRQTVLQSFSDVENSLVAYAQDQIRTKAINDEVAANQRAVTLSTQLYERGLGDFLNVLTAERSLYSAQSDQAVSQQNVATDLVQLYKALGGGWDASDEKKFEKFEDPATPAPLQ
jgi:NodT family efflux transporter outer membrane factor (OMF) lipoprotein